MGLFDGILDKLKGLFASIIGAAGRFFDHLFSAEVNIVENLHRIVDAFNHTKESVEREIETLKNFKFNPSWSSRVINVPKAIEAIKGLVAEISNGFKDKFEIIKAPIHELSLIFKAESEVVPDQEKPNALARSAVKIDEIATMISQLATAMEKIQEFAELFEKVTKDIENLEELFLPQGRPKQTVTVTYKKRIG